MKTSIKITESTFVMENILIKEMDIPRTTFHRRAIDYFLNSGEKIHPNLLIKDRQNPDYVVKDKAEQIYLDEGRRQKLLKVAEENNCGITIVLFQALLSYCSVMAPSVLGIETINKLFAQQKQNERISVYADKLKSINKTSKEE